MRLGKRSIVVGLGAAAVLLASGSPAFAQYRYAGQADAGSRLEVCAATLDVRNDKPDQGDGYYIGQLQKPETFTVESFSGAWVYGFAWGDTNKHGWVENGWFC